MSLVNCRLISGHFYCCIGEMFHTAIDKRAMWFSVQDTDFVICTYILPGLNTFITTLTKQPFYFLGISVFST